MFVLVHRTDEIHGVDSTAALALEVEGQSTALLETPAIVPRPRGYVFSAFNRLLLYNTSANNNARLTILEDIFPNNCKPF